MVASKKVTKSASTNETAADNNAAQSSSSFSTSNGTSDNSGDQYYSNTAQRSKYSYHHPQPPYQPIQHISHTCLIKRNTSSEQVIHLPTAVPHLILIGAQKSATSEFQVLADKYINVITPLSAKKFEPHFLEWHVEGALMKMIRANETAEFDDAVCRFRQKYTEFFNMSQVNNNTMSVVMEKTPSYMLHHNLPLIIDVLCPGNPKFW